MILGWDGSAACNVTSGDGRTAAKATRMYLVVLFIDVVLLRTRIGKQADEYELVLVGIAESRAAAKIRNGGGWASAPKLTPRARIFRFQDTHQLRAVGGQVEINPPALGLHQRVAIVHRIIDVGPPRLGKSS